MTIKRNNGMMIIIGLLLAVGVFYVSPAMAQDAQTVERLERMIKQQQQQLESMQQQLNQLKQTASDAQTQAKEAKSAAEGEVTTAQGPPERGVTSGQKEVNLAISGQVNRAVNLIDDGKNTDLYFVDSDASNTRVRFIGTAKATDDLTLGSRLEIAATSNESGEVSQDNEDSGDFFNVRWADLTLASKSYGKLWLGKGSTASDNTAEVDLSGVDVIAYSSVADIAGGMLFREKSGDNSLTTVSVADAFNNRDGLGRQNRVRYDTPTFWGFHLAGGAISNQRYDGALLWGGQGYGFKAAAAAAIANPNRDNTDLQYDGSFSILHEGTGLNLTASAGLLDRDDEGDPTNFYIKGGWRTQFFSVGQTAFGVDYNRSVNLPTGRDDGYSVGVAAVQVFEDYGTELYLQYRLYSLNRDVAPSVENMNVGTVGARVRF
jgi:type II secretory pathway pseudopilin PulG